MEWFHKLVDKWGPMGIIVPVCLMMFPVTYLLIVTGKKTMDNTYGSEMVNGYNWRVEKKELANSKCYYIYKTDNSVFTIPCEEEENVNQ